MQITVIDDIGEFDKLRDAWDAAYSADPHAQVFVSWPWLRAWFETTPYHWFVLAFRTNATLSHVAFMPLGIRSVRKNRFTFRELHMAGNPLSDHTGLVCSPEYEEKAISTLANYVQQDLNWDIFQLNDVFDAKLDSFQDKFSQRKFNIHQLDDTMCPFIRLPKTWDQYLRDFLSKNDRKKSRRCLSQIDDFCEYNVTCPTNNNFERHIDIFMKLHQLRWSSPTTLLNTWRTIFRRCFDNNLLYLPILWYKQIPIAARAEFIDRRKNNFSAYVSGWDKNFAMISPGNILRIHSVRYAIENGFQIYDLLRGNEAYKTSWYGAAERFNKNTIITRKSLKLRSNNLLKFIKRQTKKIVGRS